MFRFMIRMMTFCVVLTTAMMLGSLSKAQAAGHWQGSHGGSWGSHGGSHGGSWGSHGGSWGSHGGSWASHRVSYGGSHGVLFPRIRHGVSHVVHPFNHHHHCYVLRRSWGSHGSHGSSGGTVRYYSPGSKAESTNTDKDKSDKKEAQPKLPDPIPTPLPGPAKGAAILGDALLAVEVPEDATIFVNGTETTSLGEHREYISHGLTPGLNYSYEVRAEATRHGRTITETKIVQLHAGDTAKLSFTLSAVETPSTTLTLNVPHDATIFLGGNETKGSGEVRVFTTTALASGKKWSTYKVRVIVERNGRHMSQEETIILASGQSQTLSFDFNASRVADAR